jgi:nucleotide-binding universal stress UspA family protein
MNNQKILVPVDFSEASPAAIHLANTLAMKSNTSVTLIHIKTNKSHEDALQRMSDLVGEAKSASSVQFNFLLKEGDVLKEIADTANNEEYGLMVIGSHGIKGIREKVFGTDILKLLKVIAIPVVSIQKDYQVSEKGFETILFPVSSHNAFDHKIKATIDMARLFGAEVHIYSVAKPGLELSEEAVENIKKAKSEFEKYHIPYTRVKDVQDSFSVGYSKQIMNYAIKNNISLIAFMSNPTKENYYFADADKEIILTHNANIPVLSTCDKSIF